MQQKRGKRAPCFKKIKAKGEPDRRKKTRQETDDQRGDLTRIEGGGSYFSLPSLRDGKDQLKGSFLQIERNEPRNKNKQEKAYSTNPWQASQKSEKKSDEKRRNVFPGRGTAFSIEPCNRGGKPTCGNKSVTRSRRQGRLPKSRQGWACQGKDLKKRKRVGGPWP